MSYKLKSYHYCIDCGKKHDIPTKYPSCKICFSNYRNGITPGYCQKCLQPKDSNQYGLCLKCYNEVMTLNMIALRH